jgi:hypothetical protein
LRPSIAGTAKNSAFIGKCEQGDFYRTASDTLTIVVRIFGWTLTLLVLAPFAWRDWRIRSIAAVLVGCFAGMLPETFHLPHYAAPLIAAVALLPACAAEKAWRIRIGSVPYGAIFTCLVFAAACASPLARAVRFGSNGPIRGGSFGFMRAELLRRLSEMDGEQLVIVRYPSPNWRVEQEWVYNGADIDSTEGCVRP